MEFNKIICFDIKGKTGHFKKYYSNKSSLSYLLPTRSVLMGMVGSILEYPRDSYYDDLSSDNAKFGLQIINPAYKHLECMNYLRKEGGHTQVRLQLLLPKGAKNLKYRVYFTHRNEEFINRLENKLKNGKFGYGLFFGQRQFRAVAEYIETIDQLDIINNFTGALSSLTYKDNIKSINSSTEVDLIMENMPVNFDEVDSGREPDEMASFCYEENGRNIKGSFNQGIKFKDKIISFYTPVEGG